MSQNQVWYISYYIVPRPKRSVSHVYGITYPNVVHFMLDDGCEDANTSTYHYMKSLVTSGQQQLDRYTSYDGHSCCKVPRTQKLYISCYKVPQTQVRYISYYMVLQTQMRYILYTRYHGPKCVVHSMSEDRCDDVDPSTYHHITSLVTSGQ